MDRPNTETATYSQFQNNTNGRWWLDPGLRANVLHCCSLYFCVFYLGYDASLLNGLQNIPQWNAYFGNPTGNYLGLISASLFLPAIVTPYFSSAVNSRFGRKPALWIGSIILIAGAIVNSTATSSGTFIGGRVLMGVAGSFGKITAIALLQEIAHPRLRPLLSCIFYANYYAGSITAAWFTYGALEWGKNDWAWRGPCLFQIFSPLVVLVALFWIPESPRWLVHHGHKDKALALLAKYHSNGDVNDELVLHELHEICSALELEEKDNRATFSDFLKTSGNRRRLLVLFTMAIGTNWTGNGVITYYLTPVLRLVGIKNVKQIAGINGGLAIWNLILAFSGALSAERLGRRSLWLISTAGCLVSFIIITGLSGGFAASGEKATGLATIPILFIFYGFYDFCWTPLPFSYGAEILPYHMRLKGLSILLSVQSILQAFNQYVNPVALDAIHWKYYFVYVFLDAVYLVIIFFFFPETRSLTIEEVSVIFDKDRLGINPAVATEFGQRTRPDEGAKAEHGSEKNINIDEIEG
ncbi:general substrate transporter [Nemania sp. FL0031]|nr:general substrate transporter [Nemania sp. FL0031]